MIQLKSKETVQKLKKKKKIQLFHLIKYKQ